MFFGGSSRWGSQTVLFLASSISSLAATRADPSLALLQRGDRPVTVRTIGPPTIVSGGGDGGLLDAPFGRLRSPYVLVFAAVPDGVFLSFLLSFVGHRLGFGSRSNN